jgi:hypothetical protein
MMDIGIGVRYFGSFELAAASVRHAAGRPASDQRGYVQRSHRRIRTGDSHFAVLASMSERGGTLTMATTTSPLTDVLHSENHSKLSSEEIAKALAHHNKKHPAAKAESASLKTKKATKK